jgi:hypothetical protein
VDNISAGQIDSNSTISAAMRDKLAAAAADGTLCADVLAETLLRAIAALEACTLDDPDCRDRR